MAPNTESKVIENPNDSLNIPEWITEDIFRETLEQDFPTYKKVTKFVPIAAIGPGENNTSTMLRVHLDVELKDGSTVSTSYIVKTAIENANTRKFIDLINAFPKEKEIYESILPKFEELYAKAGKPIKFGPCCKFIKNTPENITFIMEDLRQRNFSNISRQDGLDMHHMTKVLKKLADFHAASAVYSEQIGPFSEQLCNSVYYAERREYMKKLSLDGVFAEVLSKWGDCEKYIPLWPNSDKTFDWCLNATIPDPNEFNVLNHGDFWSNNIMFQYNDDGKVNETYFVDYQVTFWGTPAKDLYFLITASAHYDVRVSEFDRFLKIYHENLAENLRLLKYSKPIPTLKDIHIMMLRNSLWSFRTATAVLSSILADPDKEASIDSLVKADGANFRMKLLMNPRFVKTMKQLLPWWENRGLFEF